MKIALQKQNSINDLEEELFDRTVVLQVVPNKALDISIEDQVLHGVATLMTRIQETMKEIRRKTKAITPTYNHVLLDMAIKHKPAYLEFYKFC